MECFSKAITLLVAHLVRSNLAVPPGDNDCSTCKNLVDTLLYGVSQTKKAHFGGGNTAWEEEKLGKYHNSEMRYHDIVEYACKSFDGVAIEKENEQKCHSFMSDHEEDIENWYFYKQTQFPDLKTWLCINVAQTCCPKNTWGAECIPCPGDPDRPCFGRGKCDGEGTRRGTGKCKCDQGYQGKLCRKCTTNYFASFQNDTHVTCQECNRACKGGCTGPEATNCVNCKVGWTFVDGKECKDLNECDQSPCKGDNEECKNTIGSYRCVCKKNYKKENGVCILDISEDKSDDDNDVTYSEEDERSVEKEQIHDKLDVPSPDDESAKLVDNNSEKADMKKPEEIVHEAPTKSQDRASVKPKESIPKTTAKTAENKIPREPRPPMTEEHRRKVKEHLKQVMDTIESLQKGGGSLPRNKNVRYSDPQVQAVMDKLDKVKDKDHDDYGIHKIEL